MPEIHPLVRDLILCFLSCATAGWGGIFPEEILVVAAGIWTAQYADSYSPYHWLMLPAVWSGVLLSDLILYGIGRRYGVHLFRYAFFRRLLPPEKLQRIEKNFQRYGVLILFFGRLVPGIRLPLFISAGMMKLSPARFLLADFFGAILGNSTLFLLAYWFGTQFQELVVAFEGKVSAARPVLIIALILGVVGYLLVSVLRRPYPTGDPEEVPIIGHQIAMHIQHPEKQPDEEPDLDVAGKEAEAVVERTPGK